MVALWADTLVSGQLYLRSTWQNPVWTLAHTNPVFTHLLQLETLFLLLKGVHLRELRPYNVSLVFYEQRGREGVENVAPMKTCLIYRCIRFERLCLQSLATYCTNSPKNFFLTPDHIWEHYFRISQLKGLGPDFGTLITWKPTVSCTLDAAILKINKYSVINHSIEPLSSTSTSAKHMTIPWHKRHHSRFGRNGKTSNFFINPSQFCYKCNIVSWLYRLSDTFKAPDNFKARCQGAYSPRDVNGLIPPFEALISYSNYTCTHRITEGFIIPLQNFPDILHSFCSKRVKPGHYSVIILRLIWYANKKRMDTFRNNSVCIQEMNGAQVIYNMVKSYRSKGRNKFLSLVSL